MKILHCKPSWDHEGATNAQVNGNEQRNIDYKLWATKRIKIVTNDNLHIDSATPIVLTTTTRILPRG